MKIKTLDRVKLKNLKYYRFIFFRQNFLVEFFDKLKEMECLNEIV